MGIASYLTQNASNIGLVNFEIYEDFPIYKDLDQKTVIVPTAVLSADHGLVIIFTSMDRTYMDLERHLPEYKDNMDEMYRLLYSKLVKNPLLNKGRNNLYINITTVIYSPSIQRGSEEHDDIEFVFSEAQINTLFRKISTNNEKLDLQIYDEALATIEGAKGIILPRKRAIDDSQTHTKGYAANLVEKEICQFDIEQKKANFSDITGISRIRGLAGSGKTVILCMKAALLHLKYPDDVVVFTFYTKSLYQHVRRLITRFYRQFDDKDPNWDKLLIMHAWGSFSQIGVYKTACERYGVAPLSFESAQGKGKQAFDYVCEELLQSMPKSAVPLFDYMLIDEGQDFPPSFLKLCARIVKDAKFVYAYDDLQTIFQRKAPDAKDVFGVDSNGRAKYSFAFDKILYKCYRNPLQVIVVAHAIGFGIYAEEIVQMIEPEYWNDIGYTISKGCFNAGDDMIITRPNDNSQITLSSLYGINDMINVKTFDNFRSEVEFVCKKISEDINIELLHPDDILVVSVDDRYASGYLNAIETILSETYGIKSNNIHADKFSINDFQIENKVTLSTIHKAKGNEAYSVYVVGLDALFPYKRNVRERNVLFTAMTRAKGWLTMTGIGNQAESWKNEIEKAKAECPSLKFTYPTESQIKIMTRDMDEAAVIANHRDRIAEDLLKTMDVEQAIEYLKQKSKRKG